MTTLDRYRGCLLGLATGDALGTTLEFEQPGSFEPLTDMVGGGPFNLKPGEWTDDTSMALCLAESLVTKKDFDPVHQLETYCRWWLDGHLSVKGRCFDIGTATRGALYRFKQNPQPFCGDTGPHSAGNGSLMRLAPAPLAFAGDPVRAIDLAGESSRTTHATAECVEACRYFAGLLLAAIGGMSKAQILNNNYEPAMAYFLRNPLTGKVGAIAGGSFALKDPPQIRGSGYVIHTLEAALWAFHRTDNFRDGALKVVNLGEDADTTGAVYGQIAGAYYGVEGIPAEWREKLAMRELLERRAAELHAMAFPGERGRKPPVGFEEGGGAADQQGAHAPRSPTRTRLADQQGAHAPRSPRVTSPPSSPAGGRTHRPVRCTVRRSSPPPAPTRGTST